MYGVIALFDKNTEQSSGDLFKRLTNSPVYS